MKNDFLNLISKISDDDLLTYLYVFCQFTVVNHDMFQKGVLHA